MAYTTKYHFTHTDRLGATVLVNLRLRDYVGADTLLALGGIQFEFGKSLSSSVVRGSAAKIGLWSLTQGQFSEFRDITDRKWQVEVIKGGSTYWYGWLTPEIFSEPFKHSLPYRIEVTAVDGLGDLANMDYSPAVAISTGSTRMPLSTIILQCLVQTALSLPCCFSSGLRPSGTTGDPFQVAYYDNANFVDNEGVALKCSDVLERLLPFGITIKQWRGKWYIIRTEDLSAPVHIYEYTSAGVYSSDYTADLNETIDNPSSITPNNLILNQSAIMSQEQAYKLALVKEDYGLRDSMLANGSFVNGLGGWTDATGSLAYKNDKDITYGYLYAKDASGVTTGMTQTLAVEASSDAFVFSLKVAPFGYAWNASVGYTPLKVPVRFRVKLTGSSTTYYLDKAKGWVTTPTYIDIADVVCTHMGLEVNWFVVKITSIGMPVSGSLEVMLCKLPYITFASSTYLVTGIGYTEVLAYQIGTAYLASKEIKAINNTDYNYIPAEPTLYLNDAPAVTNARLMYRNYLSSSAGVPTTLWAVDGITGSYTLTELYLRHTISMHRRPLKVINMTFMGSLEWTGTITDADGNYYEVVTATLNDRECSWQVELREILTYADLGPVITVVSSSSSPTVVSGTGTASSSEINPGILLVRFDFTSQSSPAITDYDADYSNAHGQYPTVRLFTLDGSGNIEEQSAKPKFMMVSGKIDSIVFDLGTPQTGFLILS